MGRIFIRKNINSVAIIIFIVVFVFIQYLQPSFLYNKDGSIKHFGMGRRNKTILPIWLLTFIIAMFSYLVVLYYLTFPKF